MLALKNVYKIFPDRAKFALKNVNLFFTPGDFSILIGSNGSGKSTLLKLISGEQLVSSGEIVRDKKLVVSSVAQDVNKGTVAEMSLLENMVLSSLHGKKAKYSFYRNRKKEMFEKISSLGLGLEKFIELPISYLSGGQRQVIASLMALNNNPDILLLDEHTSALDPKIGKFLIEYTAQQISEKNITGIMVTHKLDDALKYGNRLIMLHQGQIVLDARNDDKKKFSIEQLLELFHQYEDLTLRG